MSGCRPADRDPELKTTHKASVNQTESQILEYPADFSIEALIEAFHKAGSQMGLEIADPQRHIYYDTKSPLLFRLGPTPNNDPFLLPQSGQLLRRTNEDEKVVYEITYFKNDSVWIEAIAVLDEEVFNDPNRIKAIEARFHEIGATLTKQLER